MMRNVSKWLLNCFWQVCLIRKWLSGKKGNMTWMMLQLQEMQVVWLPNGVTRFVSRNFVASSVDKSCSYGLNGLDPEQMVHNKVGRLSLETTDTWNAIFDGVMWFFSYDKRSPRNTCINTSNTQEIKDTKTSSIDLCQ